MGGLDGFRLGVAWMTTAIWAAYEIRGLFDPSHPAPPEVTTVLLAVIGWLAGPPIVRAIRRANGGGTDDS